MAELAESDRAAARVTAEDLGKRLREKAANKTPLLATYVEECERESLLQTFAEADRLAINMQSSHRANAVWAIGSGGAATVVGLISLHAQFEGVAGVLIAFAEFVLFVLAAVFVSRGLLSYRKEAWLAIRYKAELYRLLIYGLLIDPALWTRRKPGPGGWDGFFRSPRQRIGILPNENPEMLACAESFPAIPGPSESEGADPLAVRDLGQFYRDTIMDEQIAYFRRKKELERWYLSPRLPSIFFVLTAILVFIHLAYASSAWVSSRVLPALPFSRQADALFLELSLIVVVVWAGLRTWLAANEFSRNAFRAQARLNALVECQDALDRALKVQRVTNSSMDSWRVFATLALCQAQLEAEQREWLRLMVETEWY